MEHYLILARSITFAQRMQSALDRAGIRCQIFRAPRDLTDMGCAYTVQIQAADLAAALRVPDLTPALLALRRASLDPVQIFLYQRGLYQEVGT